MINLWCHDIGREQAANRPLLKTIFEVLMRLFSPRKTTLLLVIRDKTKTPIEYLAQALKEDIQKIWDSVPKPDVYKEAALSDFFNVDVSALSSYEEKEEQFKEQVGKLRHRFINSIVPRGLAADRRGVVPASGFCISAMQIWKVIQENKDLNLPAHKVMVATVRCEEIADEILRCFVSDEGWLELEAAVISGPVTGFGTKFSALVDFYLSEYDMEAMYFDESVRTVKRQQLESDILHQGYPSFETLMKHLHRTVLGKFKSDLEQSLRGGGRFAASARYCSQSSLVEFEVGWRDAVVKYVDWDGTNIRNKLQEHVEVHISSVRTAKLDELKATYKKKLSDALSGPVQSILKTGERDSWASLGRLYRRETENAILRFLNSLSEYELDQTTSDQMVLELREHARCTVENKAREEAGNILLHMKERFSTRSIEFTSDPLASSTWQEVSPKDTLITPVQCISIWRQFKAETEYPVAQAISMQEAHRRSNKWLPPAWTILLLALLGFNEFMFLVRNPVYILGLFLAFVLSYALWLQYDITAYFRHGTVSGLLTISSSLLPTIMEIVMAITNISHKKKHSSHLSRQAGPHHTQSFRNQTRKHAQVHYHASPDSSSSSSSVDSNSDHEC
uniref:Uncharacterized protein n=1 Tax=Avena sativa TaxID=4498 RepID=A0ACD5YZ61_AVESA